ncbi:N-acetylmuramoyl-L-alanine amidase [Clostridium botulinum]|uniref:N-acetylmuramoyl-L-alanine amidase n=1 Tax=Clostridium botulinum TaxID=1491 RepID=UPI002238187D|nr:N-acetylmuramoyl-L-alanine amidase [Clostridium botulinum]MCW6084024.1 N-acetylmuramoyl-L-alanine amidase [Clostridium botulinum]
MIKKRSYLLPKIISLFIVLFLFSVKVQAISNISINLKTPIHEGAINDKELKIDGEIESISKLKLVYVYINDENIGQAKVDEFEFKENTYKTKLEYSKDISYLKDGLYNLKILAIDEKDNREEKEFNVKIEKNEEQLENDKNTAQRYLEKSTANINNTEKVLNSVSSVSNVATISSLEVSLNGSVVTNGKLEQGKSYTIKGSGSSANGVLYQFWIKDPYTQVWQMIRDYGTGNSMNWTPTRTGKYLVGIHVKDKNSKERLDNHKYEEYSVVSPKKATIDNLEISLNDNKIVNNDLKTGEIYKIKAYGKSSNGVLYEYWIKDLSKNLWTKIKDYSTSNEITWIPNKSGKYLIGVHVKDKYSQERLDNHKYVEYNIKLSKKAVISNLEVSLNGQSIQNNELQSGKSYNIKAYAESLNGVLYEYWIKDLTENLWTKIGDYSSSNTATWTPNKSGKYLIGVHVKDKYSQEKLDNHKYEEYNVQGGLIKTIVLDAGHGGRDSGAVSSKATGSLHEADIVQKITIKLGNLLKSKGYNVIYTRDKVDNYNYPSVTQNLEDRINVANSIKADLFMSIHADSADSSSANGYGSHYSTYRPNLDNSGVYMQGDVWYDRTPCDAALKSKVLSQLIVNEMSSLGGSNRGIEDHNLYVTRNALMPSVLVETGFVSNDTEVRKLNSDSYQNQIAQKLYNAITKLFSM